MVARIESCRGKELKSGREESQGIGESRVVDLKRFRSGDLKK